RLRASSSSSAQTDGKLAATNRRTSSSERLTPSGLPHCSASLVPSVGNSATSTLNGRKKRGQLFFPSSCQLFSWTSTPYFLAAFLIRSQASSRSLSETPSTWSKRAIALRTWLAFSIGSLRSFGNAYWLSLRCSRSFASSSLIWSLLPANNEQPLR